MGALLFNDKQLSINNNQSCAACHAPARAGPDPSRTSTSTGAVYEGSIHGRFGNRKPPSSAYATTSPILELVDPETGFFVGGNFWDGRATGEKLGNPAADQAQGPFLNPVEQALPDAACVVYQACTAGLYGGLFQAGLGSRRLRHRLAEQAADEGALRDRGRLGAALRRGPRQGKHGVR